MSNRYTAARSVIAALALSILMTGCGGGDAAPPATSVAPPVVVTPPNETIEGVATPSSVAVVTATNAQ